MRNTERNLEPFQITENWFSLSFISLVFRVINSVTRRPVPYNVAKIALSRAIFNVFFSNIHGATKIS